MIIHPYLYICICIGKEELLISKTVEDVLSVEIQNNSASAFKNVTKLFKYNVLNRIEMVTTALIPALTPPRYRYTDIHNPYT
jgi:hypothetical protein